MGVDHRGHAMDGTEPLSDPPEPTDPFATVRGPTPPWRRTLVPRDGAVGPYPGRPTLPHTAEGGEIRRPI